MPEAQLRRGTLPGLSPALAMNLQPRFLAEIRSKRLERDPRQKASGDLSYKTGLLLFEIR